MEGKGATRFHERLGLRDWTAGAAVAFSLVAAVVSFVLLPAPRSASAQGMRGGQAVSLERAKEELRNGIARQRAGDLGGAEEAYESAISYFPNLAEAHGNLCSVHLARKSVDRAVDACRRALAIQPGLETARYNLAQALLAKGSYGEAAATYKEIARARPRDAKVFAGLGSAYFAMRAYPDAATALYQAVTLDPSNFEARYNLAVTYEALGKKREAAAQYRQCVTLLPPGASRDRMEQAAKRVESEGP